MQFGTGGAFLELSFRLSITLLVKMKRVVLLLCIVAAALAQDPDQVVSYADGEWNCADPACDERVNEGDSQPNYECAEFVSRCLAAGGYIPNLSQNDSQSAYYNYQYQGTNYDLLWVSSVQGQPLGLEDLLQVLGWKYVDIRLEVFPFEE